MLNDIFLNPFTVMETKTNNFIHYPELTDNILKNLTSLHISLNYFATQTVRPALLPNISGHFTKGPLSG